ncbi:MAG: hypothetical protein C4527_26665 [Candidatus Omnitrophota bacterium]|nr:MAG: hypothetical protein C4527_26665 [Candidatus Omnitrophota bacterium]
MIKIRFVFPAIVVFFLAVPFMAGGQELMAVYPSAGATVQFSDLTTRGFEFQYPEGAISFLILIDGTSFPVFPALKANSSPFLLPQNFSPYFKNGPYQWQVTITEGEGKDMITEWTPFTIGSVVNLRPTPTPTPAQTVPPSADVTPTPTPSIGMPSDIFYEPAQSLHMSQSNLLTIRWSPPSFPAGTTFLYDIMILPPYGSDEIIGLDLQTESYKPFSAVTTRTGIYTVYLRAKDALGRLGNIVISSFEIGFSQPIIQPTSTPKPLDPDLLRDNKIDVLDVLAFAKSFGMRKGQPDYDANADFNADDKIDVNDLLIFQALFLNRQQTLAAPIWLYADVPVFQMDEFQPVETGRTQVHFPPNAIQFGQSDPRFKYAELYGTQFFFSLVEGAGNYQVNIRSELYGSNFQVTPGRQFTTNGLNSFQIVRTEPDILLIQVRAVGDNSQLGASSESLRIVIPD